MLGAVLAIAAGVTIGAGVISFICDELSESEREKQREMQNKYDDYKQLRLSDIDRINRYKQQQIDDVNTRKKVTMSTVYSEQHIQLANKRRELLDYYCQMTDERIAEKRKLSDEIKQAIELLFSSLHNQNHTMLRINTLNQLVLELQEAQQKARAYVAYLGKYKKHITKYCTSPATPAPAPFDFLLPQNFFYKGKLLRWNKETILDKGIVKIESAGDLKYDFDEIKVLEQYQEGAIVPLLCGNFNTQTYSTSLSVVKGEFKYTVINTPKVGIRAEVVGYSSNGTVELLYNNTMILRLPQRNFENPKRRPPVGAYLRVFPVKWDYDLSKNIEVSERPSDSLSNYNFQNIPLMFSDLGWNELEGYLKKHDLLNSEDEWKIAPFDETQIPNVNQVKFQLGTDLIFLACLENKPAHSGQPYFRYERLLDINTFSLKPEDVFIAIDCVLDVVLESELFKLENQTYENMADLSIMVFNEFKLQYQTKMSQNGMQYFNKWAEITDKLITFLHKGRSIEVDIQEIEAEEFFDKKVGSKAYRIYFEKPELILEYTEKIYSNAYNKKFVEFFVEFSMGEYSFIEFSQNCDYMRIFSEKAIECFGQQKSVRIFTKNFCYAEYQQSAALHSFRVGKLANPLLQIYALNAINITEHIEPFVINQFYNKNLPSDESQRAAVEKVLNETDMFLIQGPPGTGKTTVIREIIRQFIETHEASRILIVSQANVAVDNVLKGLINDYKNVSVRCGQADRIDGDIIDISFERKYQSYVAKMESKVGTDCNQDILKRWLEVVDARNGYNPDIGELIMKGHKIIAATCVGFAKKKIGLDRITFDLVIIDEAGKALPAEILIPFIKAKKVVLIGDHKQLPPTINTALFDDKKIQIENRDIHSEQLFDESFFNRMFINTPETNRCMLTTQYRMPTLIGSLISQLFYDNLIKNGTGTEQKRPMFFESNLTLIDMSDDDEYCESKENSISVTNDKEAEFLSVLLSNIRATIPSGKARIAVITPYKGQKRNLLKTLFNKGINPKSINVDINTVDAFQGDEAEIVIFCTTRSKIPTNYFSDLRRVNVALSRAKNDLVIVGSLKYFYKFKGEQAVLPKIADYIKIYGNIVKPTAFSTIVTKNSNLPIVDIILIDEILVSDDFKLTPPSGVKVEKLKEYFYRTGELDKPIVVRYQNGVCYLIDKYLRYFVAKELGLTEIKVIIETT